VQNKELYLNHGQDYGGKRIRKISQFVKKRLGYQRRNVAVTKSSAEVVIEREAPPPDVLLNDSPIPDTESSVSTLIKSTDYQTCPLKYKYVNVCGCRYYNTIQFVYGSAIHEAIKFYHHTEKR